MPQGGSTKQIRMHGDGVYESKGYVNIGEGVYENFWTVGGGSTKYSSKKGGGLGKKIQFLKISTHPPSDNK